MFEDRIDELMDGIIELNYRLKDIKREVKEEYIKANNINNKVYGRLQMLERQYDFYNGAEEIGKALDDIYDEFNETGRKEKELYDLLDWLDEITTKIDFIR